MALTLAVWKTHQRVLLFLSASGPNSFIPYRISTERSKGQPCWDGSGRISAPLCVCSVCELHISPFLRSHTFGRPHFIHSLIKLPSVRVCVYATVPGGNESRLNQNRRKSLAQLCSFRVTSFVLGRLWGEAERARGCVDRRGRLVWWPVWSISHLAERWITVRAALHPPLRNSESISHPAWIQLSLPLPGWLSRLVTCLAACTTDYMDRLLRSKVKTVKRSTSCVSHTETQ